jgi:hypothetical protein
MSCPLHRDDILLTYGFTPTRFALIELVWLAAIALQMSQKYKSAKLLSLAFTAIR